MKLKLSVAMLEFLSETNIFGFCQKLDLRFA